MVNGLKKSNLRKSDFESEVEFVHNDLYRRGNLRVFTTRWADLSRKECDQCSLVRCSTTVTPLP